MTLFVPYGVIWDSQLKTPVTSGTEVVFGTDNPIGHPLPAWERFQMQYIMHRTTGIMGTAEFNKDRQ